MEYKELWIALAVVITASFAVLGAIHNAPPSPQEVVTTDGRVVFNMDAIRNEQGGSVTRVPRCPNLFKAG
jgi:nitric oxide reductase subunit B